MVAQPSRGGTRDELGSSTVTLNVPGGKVPGVVVEGEKIMLCGVFCMDFHFTGEC